MVLQVLTALVGVFAVAMIFPEAPAGVFIVAALGAAGGSAWLLARLKYGRGISVSLRRRID